MYLHSIRIIKDPDALASLTVIAMHDRIDDRFTQHFQGVLRNIYAFPPLNARPHRYIAAETNRLSKEDTHHFPWMMKNWGLYPKKSIPALVGTISPPSRTTAHPIPTSTCSTCSNRPGWRSRVERCLR